MHNTGISGEKYWLFDEDDSNEQKQKYAKVAILVWVVFIINSVEQLQTLPKRIEGFCVFRNGLISISD